MRMAVKSENTWHNLIHRERQAREMLEVMELAASGDGATAGKQVEGVA